MLHPAAEARCIHALCSLLCNLCIASAANRARVLNKHEVVGLLTMHLNDPKIYKKPDQKPEEKSKGETNDEKPKPKDLSKDPVQEKIDGWNVYDFMALETLEQAVAFHENATKRK